MAESRRPAVSVEVLAEWCVRWLGAAAVRDRLRNHAGTPVIGHGDWHPDNLRWRSAELVAVHDWDSVICQPEPAVVGFAAVSFRGIENAATMATVDDSADFLAAYQQARGCDWTAEEAATSWAAGLWQRAVDAKVQSVRSPSGDPQQFLTRDEAAARLSRAGLDPQPAVDEGRSRTPTTQVSTPRPSPPNAVPVRRR